MIKAFEPDPGDVCLDMWVGKIEKISDKVTVQFADGARFVIFLCCAG